jgi:FkbM family methyltransferase
MSYGQNKEDDILLEHFRDTPPGRLLDVGAWAPCALSNSRALIELGWHAVLVEPSPKPFCGLLDAYGGNPAVQLVNAAVADTAGLKTWHDSGGDAVSTLDESHRRKWAGSVTYRPMLVSTITVADLLAAVGSAFDLLSLDVEGHSAMLLRQFPIEEMTRLGGIVVEHDGHADALASWAGAFGFREAARNNENLVLLR